MESFEQWLDREYRYAATAMLQSISRTDLIKSRPGFGQTIRAARGSVVASPVLAAYDPDPDYFFHWYRDSAVVIDALRLLHEQDADALERFGDFVRFSAALRTLDGRTLTASPSWRAQVADNFTQYLRDDAELASVHGDALAAETRINPDGTLDISKWARPQHDGPPLRALTLLRWQHRVRDGEVRAELAALIRADLDFTARHWREPSFDIWEEELGLHYYTLRVSAAALEQGASWLLASGEPPLAQSYRAQAETISRVLDDFWLAEEGFYRSRILHTGARSAKELDIAVILAAIHSQDQPASHNVHDPRLHTTLARLESLFDAAYPINRNRPTATAPALGRYAGDVYYGGGPWYVATLGAAEFCFRAAHGAHDARAWNQRGDAFLATVRAFTPPGGELSEQFDQCTGAQTSAKHLAWSYAAFISCVAARRSAIY